MPSVLPKDSRCWATDMDTVAIIDTAALCAVALLAYLCLGLLAARFCGMNHTPEDDEQ